MATNPKSIEQGIKNLEANRHKGQFTAGSQAVANGRKGGQATQRLYRKKDTFRKNLKWMLACKIEVTPEMKRKLKKFGFNPDAEYTIEDWITISTLNKAMKEDLRAVDMIYEYMEEDPRTKLEEKRLKIEKEAVDAIKNSDGFMEAMNGSVGEVFEDGGDTPDTLEDSE